MDQTVQERIGDRGVADLASMNNVIRTKVLGDKSAGVRGIPDDLLKRIGPDDLVVLSSEHGFKELLQRDAVGHTVFFAVTEAGRYCLRKQGSVRQCLASGDITGFLLMFLLLTIAPWR